MFIKKIMEKTVIFALFYSVFLIGINYSQSTRSLINEGVDLYENGKYKDSEIKFRKSGEQDKHKFESYYNLGASLYKQNRFEESAVSYSEAIKNTIEKEQKAKTFYNLGNSLLKAKKN